MTPPSDALERLRDERRQIEDLFDTFARHRRDPDYRPAEAGRLAGLIFTLLRVHDELESALLQPALAREVGDHPALAHAARLRAKVGDSIERIESMTPRDPGYSREMETLARQATAWFETDEHEVFPLLDATSLDLAALEHEMAVRQEILLSAGRGGGGSGGARGGHAGGWP